jgi:hypothetical protein
MTKSEVLLLHIGAVDVIGGVGLLVLTMIGNWADKARAERERRAIRDKAN